jgi:type II secretory pathway pseudopilin PulG
VTQHRGRDSSAAFGTKELIVVIVLLGAIAFLARPTITNALHKREMTRTMNHARELYLASFHMATDGAAKSDPNLAWPGELPATTLAEYCGRLVQNNYLKAEDLQKILSAPGATCAVTAGPSTALTLTGKSALKVYKVKGGDRPTAIFAASSNYIYNTPLSPTSAPFGDKGFVVIRKRGDAGVYGRKQATVSDWGNDAAEFQSKIGRLAGAAEEGAVPSGDGAMVLVGPE